MIVIVLDTRRTAAYLRLLACMGSIMAKGWKGSEGKVIARSSLTGRYAESRKDAKTAAGSALSQRERVDRAFREANERTKTFSPKNAGKR